jgi:hypothetical protein
VSAYAGINEAIKATGLSGGTNLVDSLRIINKLDKASNYQSADLIDEYVIFTESEKKLIVDSVSAFNWAKLAAESGNTVWTNWAGFLSGIVDSESEEYALAWTEYVATNPPVEYAEWKTKHTADIAAYNQAVADAEAAAIARKAAEEQAALDAAANPAPETEAVVVESAPAEEVTPEPVVAPAAAAFDTTGAETAETVEVAPETPAA